MKQALWVVVLLAGVGAWWFLKSDSAPPPIDEGVAERPSEAPRAPDLIGSAPTQGTTPFEALDAAAYPRGAGALRGIVVTPAGEPVAGVRVTLWREAKQSFYSWYHLGTAMAVLTEAPRSANVRPMAATKSDAEGRFQFEAIDQTAPLRVRAEVAPPHASVEHAVRPSNAESIRLVVGMGSPLMIQVHDATGQGRRAVVTLQMATAQTPGLQLWDGGVHWTDGTGRLSLPSVPHGVLHVDAKVPGYASRTRVPVHVPATGDVMISLGFEPGAVVLGTVRNTKREPVAGARIVIHCGEAAHLRVPRCVRSETSNADGTYRFERLPPWRVTAIDCIADGYASPPSHIDRVLAVGEETRVDFDLAPGCFLKGRVALADGTPIPEAIVEASVFTASSASQFKARGAPDGTYTLGPMPPGKGHARPKVRGFYLAESYGQTGKRRPFTFAAAGVTILAELVMARGVPVSGRVVDASKQPVVSAAVQLRGPPTLWDRYGPAFESVATDAKGAFTFPGLPPAESYSVRVSVGSRFVDAEIQAEAANEIVLPKEASISGRVIWSDGAPKGAWHIHAQRDGDRRRRIYVTDASGSFVVRGVVAGRWTLQVKDAFGQSSGESYESEIAAGQRVSDVELRPTTFQRIEGLVVDAEGNPKAGYEVSFDPPDGSHKGFTTRSDGEGRFAAARLPPGTYAISGDGVSQPAVVPTGTLDVRLVVDQAKPVFRGTVRMPDGQPLPSGSLYVLLSRSPDSWFMVGVRSGAFWFELKPGSEIVEYRLGEAKDATGVAISCDPLSGRVAIKDPVTLQLRAAAAIQGMVVDEEGRGIPGVRIMVHDPARGGMSLAQHRTMLSDAQGRFTIVGVAKNARLMVSTAGVPEGYARPEQQAVTASDTTVRIVLTRASSVSGKVVDESGAPIRNVMITGSMGDTSVSGISAEDGTFVVTGVPFGSVGTLHTASYGQVGYLPVKIDDVRAGQTGLVVRLRAGVSILGKVVDPSGKAVGPVSIAIAGPQNHMSTSTRSDGTFTFQSLVPDATYTITAKAHGAWLGSEKTDIKAPSDDAVIRLRKGLALSGTVAGENVEGLSLRFVVPQTAAAGGPVGPKGAFALAVASEELGTIQVVDAQGNRFGMLEGVVPPRTGIAITMQAGQRISGRVVGAPKDARVRVYAEGPVRSSAYALADGTFAIQGLAPGTYRVQLMVLVRDGARRTRDDVASGSEDVNFDLAK